MIFFKELFECSEREGDSLFEDFKSDVFDNLKRQYKILKIKACYGISCIKYQQMVISTNFFSIFLAVLFFSDPREEVPPFEVGSDDLAWVTIALPGGFKEGAGSDSDNLSMPKRERKLFIIKILCRLLSTAIYDHKISLTK